MPAYLLGMTELARLYPHQARYGREYAYSWAATAVGCAGAMGTLQATGMVVDGFALLPYAALLSLLFASHYVYAIRRPSPSFALVTGGVGLMIAAALLAGVIANAGLRLRYELVDDSLVQADLALRIDTPAVVRAVASVPWLGKLLGLAYVSISPLSFVTAIWLGVRR